MACGGWCQVRMRKVVKQSVEVTAAAGNPDPPLDKYPKPADYKDGLQAKIDKWLEDRTVGTCYGDKCKCEATEEPDWDKKKTRTRTFEYEFTFNGLKWVATATLDFKSALVDGDCIETPDKPIKLAFGGNRPVVVASRKAKAAKKGRRARA